jgi:hypothetical protein
MNEMVSWEEGTRKRKTGGKKRKDLAFNEEMKGKRSFHLQKSDATLI